MKGIVAHVLAAGTGEVEAGGIRWRVRAVKPGMVRDVTYSLLHVTIPTDEELVEERAMAEWPPEERAKREAAIASAKMRAAMDPERMLANMRRDQGLACAGVTDAWNPEANNGEGGWEPIALVMPDVSAAGDLPENTIGVDQLPAATVAEISRVVWALSAGGDDAVKRIANFRRGY